MMETPPPPDIDHSTLLEHHLADHDEPCPMCGYDLRGADHKVCPECGSL